MIKYTDKGTTLQHLTDRLMKSALNNVGIKVDADVVFRSIAEDRLPVWIDELQTYDVEEVVRCKDCINWKDSVPWTTCSFLGGHWEEDMYCSYGERKND